MNDVLTLQEAKRIADLAEQKACELGIAIVVSIIDCHGNLKLFNRMDNISYGSVRVSQ